MTTEIKFAVDKLLDKPDKARKFDFLTVSSL